MTCTDFRLLIDKDYWTSTVAEGAAVAIHYRDCPTCHELLDALAAAEGHGPLTKDEHARVNEKVVKVLSDPEGCPLTLPSAYNDRNVFLE